MKKLLSLIAISMVGLHIYAADYEAEVQRIIPKLADENVSARYAAQMELQDLASQSSKPGNAPERELLGKVLASKVADESIPQPARVWMVRQLEYMGSTEAVSSLTVLLKNNNAELQECARRALEKNPSPAASDSLRAALEKADNDNWKIGLINSLGQRKDAKSVELITSSLSNSRLAGPAALALGKIGTEGAITALQQNIALTPMAAQALVDVANDQLAQGKKAFACDLYHWIYQKAPMSSMKGAALNSLIKQNADGVENMLAAVLKATDAHLQHAAVAALPYANSAIQAQVRELLPQVTPNLKAQLITTFTASSEAQVIEAASDSEESVRTAALETLGKIGSAKSVPVLIKAATSDNRAEKLAAEGSLARISGKGALSAIEKSATEGSAKARIVAINTLVARQHTPALPSLLAIARESEDTVKAAAFSALGKLGSDKEVAPVTQIILATKNSEAIAALETIVTRIKDRKSASDAIAQLAKTDDDLALLLTPLAVLGGAENLKKVTALLGGKYDEKAIVALGSWYDLSALKPLVAIMRDASMPEKRVSLALRSILQVMENSEAPSEDAANLSAIKTEAALAAIKSAKSTDDKKQVLAVIGTVPHPEIVEWVKAQLVDNQLKQEAGLAAVTLAENLFSTNKSAAQDLAKQLRDANISREVTRRANIVLRR